MKTQKEHKKSTLMKWTKEELADYVEMLEHNINVLSESFENQYNNCIKMIDQMQLITSVYDESRKLISDTLSMHKDTLEHVIMYRVVNLVCGKVIVAKGNITSYRTVNTNNTNSKIRSEFYFEAEDPMYSLWLDTEELGVSVFLTQSEAYHSLEENN